MITITRAVAIRHLLDNSTVNPLTTCWEWQSSKTKDGYGQLSKEAIVKAFSTRGAHRLSKMLFDNWEPSGRNEHTRHQCHNRCCINPDHILVGSAKENAADRTAAGLQATGESHPNARLSNADVVAIREEARAGDDRYTLAERYKVSDGHIYQIITHRIRKAG